MAFCVTATAFCDTAFWGILDHNSPEAGINDTYSHYNGYMGSTYHDLASEMQQAETSIIAETLTDLLPLHRCLIESQSKTE